MTNNSNVSGKMLATVGAVIGVIVGSSGMWFTFKDRIEKQVEERVQLRVDVAGLKKDCENLKSDVWILKNKNTTDTK